MGQKFSHRLINIAAHLMIIFIGTAALWGIYKTEIAYTPPVTWDTPGEVTPKVVRVGGEIAITRTFTVNRSTVIIVARGLAKGDCEKKCVVYDMEPSRSVLHPGHYTRTRVHQIPPTVPPGRYMLTFDALWENSLGRTYSAPLPPLELEVR